MRKSPIILSLSALVLLAACSPVSAHSPFKKPFEEKYVASTDNDDFKAAFKKGSCNVCHVKGKKKDWLNGYGLSLAKHIPGIAQERLDKAKAESRDAYKAETEKLVEELKKALVKAEADKMKDGVSFGALLKEHKLPPEDGAKSLYAKDEDGNADEHEDEQADESPNEE